MWTRTTDAKGRALVCGPVTIRDNMHADFVEITSGKRTAVVSVYALRTWTNLFSVPPPGPADLAWVTA